MQVILYEDETVSGLFPVSLTRPAFDIRSGGYTLSEAASMTFSKAVLSSLCREVVRDVSPLEVFSESHTHDEGFLFLNARLTPSFFSLQALADILKNEKEDFVLTYGDTLIGLFTKKLTHAEVAHMPTFLNSRAKGTKVTAIHWRLFNFPEDIIFFNRENLGANLSIAAENLHSKSRGLYLGKNVELSKECVIDTTKGPIIIGDDVTVHPFTVLKGPLFIGAKSIIKEFSVLENSTIGSVCKVGGEVESSVLDAYSNKQHQGCLGDSYIGRWVNIGAGTTASNLKNTYSPVSISGRGSTAQFLGTVVGDFSKIASNSVIFPGKILGVSAHAYGIVTEDVPSFTSSVCAAAHYELPLAIAEKIQRAMALRRDVAFTDSDAALLKKVFGQTQPERDDRKVLQEKTSFK